MTESLSADKGFEYISENFMRVRENIGSAAIKSGRRPEDIKLLAVTKTVEPARINYAIEKCKIKLLGENKVQELLSKTEYLNLEGVQRHLIGHLQTNKVKKIVPEVSMLQSVDSVRLASEISRVCEASGRIMDVLLEVNIGEEQSKTGFKKEELEESVCQAASLHGVCVRGLMCVPPICEKASEINKYFENMYRIFVDIGAKKYDNIFMDVLSMGMSGDYVYAIENGSNLVRIGSAIFGARIY